MNNKTYEISIGSLETGMIDMIDNKTSTLIAEFSDYKMACLFLTKCFKVIKRDEDNIPFLYTLKK
jgi:hypothetical protein